ncbi:MAG: endonuclease/exonuclease/phosphatase family protein [Desulfobacterales bacterium]|jgi:endonuclease/exonuclease/phosphatase family metal-dependent hydrolase
MRLRVATYNVHGWVGRDGKRSPQRILSVLRQIDAHVTVLQEVTAERTAEANTLLQLAQQMGAHATLGPTLTRRSHTFGNAVLSRIPLQTVTRADISVPGREPRGALAVEFRIAGRRIRLVAAHLGLHPRERRYQVQRILALLGSPLAHVTLVMGDFNEWWSRGRPLRWLNGRLGVAHAPATFPSTLPMLALDRIWVYPAHCLSALKVHRRAPAPVASDHLPLVAEVVI